MIVDPDFLDHWKTRMFVGLLGGDEGAPVYLLRLWAHCQHRRTSTFTNLSAEALKALCRFPGHANKLDSSLVASGFIRREGQAVTVCGWDEYNASLIAAWTNGSRGGRPKKKPEGLPPDDPEKPTGLRYEERGLDKRRGEKSPSETPPKSPTGESRTKGKKPVDYTPEFQEWWEAYPPIRKDKKRTAFVSWQKAVALLAERFRSSEAAIQFLQARCEEFAMSPKGRSQFANAPEVWLNGGQYDADARAWQRGDDQPAKHGKPKADIAAIARKALGE